jgi:hypothetical protein
MRGPRHWYPARSVPRCPARGKSRPAPPRRQADCPARAHQPRTSPSFRSLGVLPGVRVTAAGTVVYCPLSRCTGGSCRRVGLVHVQAGLSAMRRPADGQLLLRPLRLPPPLLAGHLSRGSALARTSPPTLVVSAGQAGCSRDRQVIFEAARLRAPKNRSDGVRTSTSPQCGASGAAPSLTPTRPTAFLRLCPAPAGRSDSSAPAGPDGPGAAQQPRLGTLKPA